MDGSVVDRIHVELLDVLGFLTAREEFELRASADEHFKKSLLIAASSYFERELTEAVINLAEEVGGVGGVLSELIKRKVVERQFHSWFDWNASSANQFFRLFGDDFRDWARAEVSANPNLDASIRDFLEIGRERNRLVHRDYGNFVMEKTVEEIYKSYQSAVFFVEWVPGALRRFVGADRE